MMNRYETLKSIQKALVEESVDFLIIPNSDPHIGEYIPDYWRIISWLTGFKGSNATIVITPVSAWLWTDSRYFIQAEREIEGSGFLLMTKGNKDTLPYYEWIAHQASDGNVIAFDGRVFPALGLRNLKNSMLASNFIVKSDFDPISPLWKERPPLPQTEAWDHTLEYAGSDRKQKLTEVRRILDDRNAEAQLLTAPEDIMWLLNIRGDDLPYTPVIFSFAIITLKQVLLFAGEKSLNKNLQSLFDNLGIVILPYEELEGMLSSLSDYKSIMIPKEVSCSIKESLPKNFHIIEDHTIPSILKARKGKVELENIADVMVKDGVALTRFLHQVENSMGLVPMTEISLSVKLHELRHQQEGYICPSFHPIIAFGKHSALPHYNATHETDVQISEDSILLIDSGGQYYGGTTDITRTISTGKPSIQQIKDFTLVLKGHISLAEAKFPAGTSGYQLDILARKALWEKGLNYGHGTGHGVGYCLSVHEGPQNISPANNKYPLEAGMIISNEPALYRTDDYGIRTESLILCYAYEETEFGDFMRFDTISLCYIDKTLIDKSMLTAVEILWLNKYHEEVYAKLSPRLDPEERLWLKEKTSPL